MKIARHILLALLRFINALINPFVFFSRKRKTEGYIAKLQEFRSDAVYGKAVEFNIGFFRAARHPVTYFLWLLCDGRKAREKRENILEFFDFPIPSVQKETHERLVELERMPFPKILEPIRKEVLRHIEEMGASKKEPIVVLNLGCGGMELERQIMESLLRGRSAPQVIFIGVDSSPAIKEVIQSNLASLRARGYLEITEMFSISSPATIKALKSQIASKQFWAVILQTNIFDLAGLPEDSFDLVCHSRFRHHLSRDNKERLDRFTSHLARRVVEFDDFCSTPVFIFPSILTWFWLLTLNGAIVSYLRDFSKVELLAWKEREKDWGMDIDDNFGFYLRVYNKNKKVP